MSGMRTSVFAVCAVTAALALSTPGAAENYPTRQIRMIVPFAGGGASDAVARIFADRLGIGLVNRLLVDNRPGAGGNIGTDMGAKSEASGHTIVFSTSGPLAVNKWLYPDLPYDPERDLEPISLVSTLPNVLVVSPKLPASTTTEFIKYAKEHPTDTFYASIGNGSSQHLAGALFESVTGVRLQHVPYKVAGQFVVDLMSGDIQSSFQLIPNVLSQLKTGKIKAIAVMSKERSKALPDVPTMAEQGVPNLESAAWFGLLAPKGTPQPIIDRLHGEVVKATSDPEVRSRLLDIGADPASSSPAEFKALMAEESLKWRDLIKSMNIKAD
jgi:tripartite-type tricarboxylate transporter receptor subunit TctC